MKWITVRQCAELYGVSEDTIRRYIKKGMIEAYQPFGKGGFIRIAYKEEMNGQILV